MAIAAIHAHLEVWAVAANLLPNGLQGTAGVLLDLVGGHGLAGLRCVLPAALVVLHPVVLAQLNAGGIDVGQTCQKIIENERYGRREPRQRDRPLPLKTAACW